jgi:hypothetical protein
MNASSPCEICHRRAVEHTCDRCGQLVCADHFDEDLGFCLECSAEVSDSPSRREQTPEPGPDGEDIYRF